MDYYNSKFAKLFAPEGSPRWAITIGQRTWYSASKENVNDEWRRHEDRHKQQWSRDGLLKFILRYSWDYIRGRLKGMNHKEAYQRIGYEVDARRAERADTSNSI